eukprot:m.269299 g.269299  ORF g.269299 m.269299 type:complete len:101 (+) comp15670_c0_seq8:395-697(+)
MCNLSSPAAKQRASEDHEGQDDNDLLTTFLHGIQSLLHFLTKMLNLAPHTLSRQATSLRSMQFRFPTMSAIKIDRKGKQSRNTLVIPTFLDHFFDEGGCD